MILVIGDERVSLVYQSLSGCVAPSYHSACEVRTKRPHSTDTKKQRTVFFRGTYEEKIQLQYLAADKMKTASLRTLIEVHVDVSGNQM